MKSTILLFAVLLAGCSTRVEVSTERPATGDPPATETFSTNFTVDLRTNADQVHRPPSQPPAPTEAKPPEVEVVGTANFAIVEGDLNLHTHYHIHTDCLPTEERPASRRNQEKSEIQVRKPKVDPRCEGLRREHVERVEGWKSMMDRSLDDFSDGNSSQGDRRGPCPSVRHNSGDFVDEDVQIRQNAPQ